MQRQRLDTTIVDMNLSESREKAQRLIRAGCVRVDGQISDKPGRPVNSCHKIEVIASERFVGRGGQKLQHAFETFRIKIGGMVCMDIGASTGGFTDCMLQNGACKVYAVDVGRGQLHWRLRMDKRVVVMEKTNARYLRADQFPDKPFFGAVDVSFISLTKVLPAISNIISTGGAFVSLIKPQFEAARSEVGSGGVIRDPEVRAREVERIRTFGVNRLELECLGVCESPIQGPAGNVEFLIYWRKK